MDLHNPLHTFAKPKGTSTAEREDARLLMQAQPDLKYTQALRLVHQGRVASARDALARQGVVPSPHNLLASLVVGRMTVGEAGVGKTSIPSHLLTSKYALHIGRLGRSPAGFDVYFDPRSTNLLVSGGAASGSTYALQFLARDALVRGWEVRSLGTKCPEYAGLADDLGPQEQTRFTAIWARDDEAFAKAIYETTPGTEETPLLLVLDGGIAGQFVAYSSTKPAPCETFGWLDHLLGLMADPNTVVAMRVQRPSSKSLSTRVRQACTAHLVMGRVDLTHQVMAFGVEVEPDQAEQVNALEDGRTVQGMGLLQATPGASPMAVRIPSWRVQGNRG